MSRQPAWIATDVARRRGVVELRATFAQLTSTFMELTAESSALRDTAESTKSANGELRARNAELRAAARATARLRPGPVPLARVRARQPAGDPER